MIWFLFLEKETQMYLCVHVCECSHENLPYFISKRIWKITITIFEVTTKNFFLRFYFIIYFFFLSSFKFRARFRRRKKKKNRDFQYHTNKHFLCHQTSIASLVINIPNHSGIFVTTEKPISTHHNHLKTTAITLGSVQSMDLEKWVVTSIYH